MTESEQTIPASRAGRTSGVALPNGAPTPWRHLGLEEKRLLLEKTLRERAARVPGAAADAPAECGAPAPWMPADAPKKRMGFSLLFFSSNERDDNPDKYELLLEASKLGDKLGFQAVWMPERHFHAVGGLFPNPSIVAAAIAVLTKQIRLRAGSVVAPLHHPVRIAEEWSVVDNLSNGRVDIAFARGWNPNDFVLAPEAFRPDNAVMLEHLETVRKLWRGDTIQLPAPTGKTAEIRIYPKPRQRELTYWMTCVGGPERFKEAGERGANILTMLFNQTVEELSRKIEVYRAARDKAAGQGVVTLMLHSFVHPDFDFVRRTVRGPFTDFIRSTISLHKEGAKVRGIEMPEDERERIAQFSYERYFRTAGIFGPPDVCANLVERLIEAGVDEIACQIDFGIDHRNVLESIPHLAALKDMFCGARTAAGAKPSIA